MFVVPPKAPSRHVFWGKPLYIVEQHINIFVGRIRNIKQTSIRLDGLVEIKIEIRSSVLLVKYDCRWCVSVSVAHDDSCGWETLGETEEVMDRT